MKFDAVIIGGGAAGLFCAATAARRGRKILVLEHNSQVGRKILISGGGRCNFTNKNVRSENFISENPHFCKSALARYTSADFIELVKKHKIKFYEKKLGQLFCKDRSNEIIQMLLSECRSGSVKILTDCSAGKITKKELYEIETNKGRFAAKNLVIATGGMSFPKIGASDFGYKIAGQFGIGLTEIRPSLVPLRFEREKFSKLSGVSVDSEVKFENAVFRENILFTHKGLSGPAILQISNYWRKNKPISINLMPENNLYDVLNSAKSKQSIKNFLGKFLPNRVAEEFSKRYFPDERISEISKKQLIQISEQINNWQVKCDETEGWHKAEVTLGGIDTNEISSQTMEVKKVSGLYFIGEVLDVTGWLGGYNFQWAWSSGFVCGQGI